MKKWILLTLVIALFGCSSTPEPKVNLYLMPSSSASTPLTQPKGLPSLVVEPLQLAAYLDTQAIVYRQSETQVILAKENLWAQRLAPQLTERITKDLRHKQATYWPTAWNATAVQQQHWKLQLRLQRFNGVYNGNAEVAGNWELVNPKGKSVFNQEFYFEIPLQEEGYPALIEALSLGMNELADLISQRLQTVN